MIINEQLDVGMLTVAAVVYAHTHVLVSLKTFAKNSVHLKRLHIVHWFRRFVCTMFRANHTTACIARTVPPAKINSDRMKSD